MNLKTMEGLAGAGVNLKNSEASMRVYRAAKREAEFQEMKGESVNTDVMERALGYTSDFIGSAGEYTEQAKEGTREEMKKLREEQLEAVKEKAKEKAEKKKEEARTEKERTEKTENTEDSEYSQVWFENNSAVSEAVTLELSAQGLKLAEGMQENL